MNRLVKRGAYILSGPSTSAAVSGSDCQSETTASKPLLRSGVLVDLLVVHPVLSFTLHLLATLLLVILSLHLLKLTSQPLYLILVLIDLSLVHVQLSSHSLHLVSLLLQVLLVDGKLLGDFWTWLTSQQVLQLKIELLLLLDGDVLLHDFLSLLDESLLKSLDLLNQLVSVWVSSLDPSPSMVVERVLKLLRKGLHLKTFFL